jgi:hypothetical protein
MKQSINDIKNKPIYEELKVVRENYQSIEANIISLDERLKEIQNKLEEGKKDPDRIPTLASLIKDELIIISFLVIYIGIISTDAYYSYFGLKYQFFQFPIFHIIYRGLTVLLQSPILWIPYILTFSLLSLDFYAIKSKWSWYQKSRTLGMYITLLILLIITYPLAIKAGRKGAELDVVEKTSSLPRIIRLKTAIDKKEIQLDANYRLLLDSGDYVVFFQPIEASDEAIYPKIHRYLKGDVYVLETNF